MKQDDSVRRAIEAVSGVILDALRSGSCVVIRLVYSRGDIRLSAERAECSGKLEVSYSTIIPHPGRKAVVKLPGNICREPGYVIERLAKLLTAVVMADTISDVIGDAVAFAEEMVCCGEERCTVRIDAALRAGGDSITEYLEISAWRGRG